MILNLKSKKKQIAIFFIWFPILFAINANLTDYIYFGSSKTANINTIRIFLYIISFIFLVIYFFLNLKKIKLLNSIFFLYLIIFIIQSNFVISENFNQLLMHYKIFFIRDISNIEKFIGDLEIGLEIQSIYMMIGTFAALLYYINFNDDKFQNTIKLKIIITSSIIVIVYLYFAFNMWRDFFFNTDKHVILLYYSPYLSNNEVFGHVMSRSTGISRILSMISITTLLFIFYIKNNLAKTFSLAFIIIINTTIILLSSRFGTYSCILMSLIIIFLINSSYLKKVIILIFISVIPYLAQYAIKEYKLYKSITKLNNSIELKIFNKDYQDLKNNFINENTIVINRGIIRENKENKSLEISTTGRTEIWKKVYGLYLNNKINVWIGNGFQADRKLLTGGNSKYYGSNVSNALLNIFVCSGMIGVLIFIYINIKIIIRIFQFIFIKKIYNNLNKNFGLIISINILLFLYLRSLVENSISYYNIDFLIFLMCLYIIDKERKII